MASSGEGRACYLCNGREFVRRPGQVRDDPSLEVLECRACGLVTLSSFDHISKEFYAESGMHAEELSVPDWLKQTEGDDTRRLEFTRQAVKNKRVLDFGCGNAGFLMRAKTAAAVAAGVEPEARLRPHFLKNGLQVWEKLSDVDETFDVITLFHVLEHLPDPRQVLEGLGRLLRPSGRIIIEVPNANDALLTLYRCEPFTRFTYWSCHLFLFTAKTLVELCAQAGFRVDAVNHIQRYPLSNHMHWLAQGKPGGHQVWQFLDSPELHAAYESRLAAREATDTVIATIVRERP